MPPLRYAFNFYTPSHNLKYASPIIGIFIACRVFNWLFFKEKLFAKLGKKQNNGTVYARLPSSHYPPFALRYQFVMPPSHYSPLHLRFQFVIPLPTIPPFTLRFQFVMPPFNYAPFPLWPFLVTLSIFFDPFLLFPFSFCLSPMLPIFFDE